MATWDGFDEAGGGAGVLAPPRGGTRRPRFLRKVSRPSRTSGGGGPEGPPRDRGDGGGDGWKDEPHRDRQPTPPTPPDVASFALGLTLVGISTVFLVLIAVWLLLWSGGDGGRVQVFGPPRSLWLSTGLLIASSLTMVRATRALALRAPERQRLIRRALGASFLFGLGFLAAQIGLWLQLYSAGLLPSTNDYGAILFALTGLHALHVIVGVFVIAWVWLAAGKPHTFRDHRLRLGATYWHFMGGLWLVLFSVLTFVR